MCGERNSPSAISPVPGAAPASPGGIAVDAGTNPPPVLPPEPEQLVASAQQTATAAATGAGGTLPAETPLPIPRPLVEGLPTAPPPPARAEPAPATRTALAQVPRTAPPDTRPAAPPPSPPSAAAQAPRPTALVVRTPPPAAEPPAATGAGSGVYRLQLTAVRSETGLTQAWAQLRQRHGNVLGSISPKVERTDTTSGPLFRLQAGPFTTREAAANACSAIRAGGGQCFIVGPIAP